MIPNNETAKFHAWDDKGLCAAKRALDAKIDAAIDAGQMKTGAYFVYGAAHTTNTDYMHELARKNRVSRIDLRVAIEMLQTDIELATKALEAIADEDRWPEHKPDWEPAGETR